LISRNRPDETLQTVKEKKMITKDVKHALTEHYRELFRQHGAVAAGVQGSEEGMIGRFEQLAKVADLSGQSVLDLGCGYGGLYPYLCQFNTDMKYKGIDLVPESIEYAAQTHTGAKWECRDILENPLTEQFDWVLICGVFNNPMPNPTDFLKELTSAAWKASNKGMAFNFISTHVNVVHQGMSYHDPLEVFEFCRSSFSNKVSMAHHYFRCDVSIFIYR
jgi:2-polyprenyl-3-methyl-5-hydroxy-6-metoxy-1,4-benzoquinol methylase